MSADFSSRPALPGDWHYPDAEESRSAYDELQREAPFGHLLYGVHVEVFAQKSGSDDVLYRHCGEPDRFTVVHLTWVGHTEINDEHPTVEFDGTFAEFLAEHERIREFLRNEAKNRDA